jgi:quinol monooxygenase YgiN
MNLTQLDALMETIEMPVRPETLVEGWELTLEGDRSLHVVVLVTMRVRPGLEELLEIAAREFVATTSGRPGSLGATVHRSPDDPQTWFMLERFATEEAFARHMSSEHLARFQAVQRTLLEGPVSAIFLEREA